MLGELNYPHKLRICFRGDNTYALILHTQHSIRRAKVVHCIRALIDSIGIRRVILMQVAHKHVCVDRSIREEGLLIVSYTPICRNCRSHSDRPWKAYDDTEKDVQVVYLSLVLSVEGLSHRLQVFLPILYM